MIEFECAECGDLTRLIDADAAPVNGLCPACEFFPGWEGDPEIVKMIEGMTARNRAH